MTKNNNFIEEVDWKKYQCKQCGQYIGSGYNHICIGRYYSDDSLKYIIDQQREELKKEIVEIAEKHIEQERYSGTPHAINTLISKIKNI